jgi:hypothetical protein
MKLTRRQFLKTAAIAGAGLALPLKFSVPRAYAFAQSPSLRKFVDTLPGLTSAGKNTTGQYIPLATKHTIPFAGRPTDLYDIAVRQFDEQMHPDLLNKTTLFGYSNLLTRNIWAG